MEAQIMNDVQLMITPNNFTENYAIREYLKNNKDKTLAELLVIEESSLWTD